MQNQSEITNPDFISLFKSGKLDPEIFTHEAHLRLAYLYLSENGIEKAIDEICQDLKNFTKHVGAEDKYHHTLTVAAIYIVNHFMQKATAKNFPAFVNEFPRLKTNFRDLIQQHYDFDLFQNTKAKKEFIEPDKLPFV